MPRYGTSIEDNPDKILQQLPLMEPEAPATAWDQKFQEFYMNMGQLFAYNFGSRDIYIRGGRGLGKTVFLSARLRLMAQTIWRGLSLFMGCSIKQIMGKTVPALCTALTEQFGFIEGVHYWRGRPPYHKLKGWSEPLQKPRAWENILAFYTGHLNMAVSTSQTAAANGLSLVGLLGDEARFLDMAVVKSDIYPALRPSLYNSPGWSVTENPVFLSTAFLSDAAITLKQMQWEREEDVINSNPEIVAVNLQIADMLAQLDLIPELADNKKFCDKLQRLRCKSRVFMNLPTIMNIEVLGIDTIKRMKRDLPPMVFDVQILGKRLKNLGSSGFYNYNSAVHGYMPNGDAQTDIIQSKMTKNFIKKDGYGVKLEWNAPDFEQTKAHADDCLLDDDLDVRLPLRIAFDVGTDFNCVIVGQVHEEDHNLAYGASQPSFGGIPRASRTLRIVNALFAKNGDRLEVLLRKFNQYYKDFRCRQKEIIFYSDQTLYQGGAYALKDKDATRFANVIKRYLAQAGWKVTEVYLGRPMAHHEKYQYMSEVYAETQPLHVRINLLQCDFLCQALEQTEATKGTKGIHKVKSKEKYQSEDGIAGPREIRTDCTDAHDTLLIGVGKYSDNGRKLDGSIFSSGIILNLPHTINI